MVEIRPDHATEGPPLQMSSLDLGIESDSIAAVAQPVAELDVFDLRCSVAGMVEHSDLEKSCPSHRATAGPETVDVSALLLVHVVMQEVPVLRDEALLRRRSVIRSKNAGKLWVPAKMFDKSPQHVRPNAHV